MLPDAGIDEMVKERSGSFGAYKNYQNLLQNYQEDDRVSNALDLMDHNLDKSQRLNAISTESPDPKNLSKPLRPAALNTFSRTLSRPQTAGVTSLLTSPGLKKLYSREQVSSIDMDVPVPDR